MKPFFLLFLFIVNVVGKVHVLTRGNVSVVTDGQPWLVEFYAPWCGFCKQLAPVWEDVGQALEGHTQVAKIDGHSFPDVSARFGISGFPTVFHVHNREVRRYAGGRTAADFKQFAHAGYHKVEPLGFRQSPFSPVGIAWGLLARGGLLLKEGQEYLQSEQSYPLPVVIAVGLAVMFALSMLVAWLIVVCLSMFESSKVAAKVKQN